MIGKNTQLHETFEEDRYAEKEINMLSAHSLPAGHSASKIMNKN